MIKSFHLSPSVDKNRQTQSLSKIIKIEFCQSVSSLIPKPFLNLVIVRVDRWKDLGAKVL